VIEVAKTDDQIVGIRLRNTSAQNLYTVGIGNMESRVGEICWWENHLNCIEARAGEFVLRPSSQIDNAHYFQDMPALQKVLQDTTSLAKLRLRQASFCLVAPS
jgi:hypothetical protein